MSCRRQQKECVTPVSSKHKLNDVHVLLLFATKITIKLRTSGVSKLIYILIAYDQKLHAPLPSLAAHELLRRMLE